MEDVSVAETIANAELMLKKTIFQCSKNHGSPTRVTMLKVTPNKADPISIKDSDSRLNLGVPFSGPNSKKVSLVDRIRVRFMVRVGVGVRVMVKVRVRVRVRVRGRVGVEIGIWDSVRLGLGLRSVSCRTREPYFRTTEPPDYRMVTEIYNPQFSILYFELLELIPQILHVVNPDPLIHIAID